MRRRFRRRGAAGRPPSPPARDLDRSERRLRPLHLPSVSGTSAAGTPHMVWWRIEAGPGYDPMPTIESAHHRVGAQRALNHGNLCTELCLCRVHTCATIDRSFSDNLLGRHAPFDEIQAVVSQMTDAKPSRPIIYRENIQNEPERTSNASIRGREPSFFASSYAKASRYQADRRFHCRLLPPQD